jgi:hypothetical protein
MEAFDREREIEEEDASQEQREGEDESHAASLSKIGSRGASEAVEPCWAPVAVCES